MDRAGITVTKCNPVRYLPSLQNGGIRVGRPAVTTSGMKEEEMLDSGRT